jgi:hypothetical protein
MTRDGSFDASCEDVTEKTDYDEIGGTDNRLRIAGRPPSGEPKTLAEAKDLKGVQRRWADDSRWFACAKKGEPLVKGVDEATRRRPTQRRRLPQRRQARSRRMSAGASR